MLTNDESVSREVARVLTILQRRIQTRGIVVQDQLREAQDQVDRNLWKGSQKLSECQGYADALTWCRNLLLAAEEEHQDGGRSV